MVFFMSFQHGHLWYKSTKNDPLSEVEINVNYAVIITTNAGLWRYKIGDTVRLHQLARIGLKLPGEPNITSMFLVKN